VDHSATPRDLLTMLKATAHADGPGLALPAGFPVEALLRPVGTRPGHLRAQDVEALTDWRNRFVHAFLNEFEANVERTAKWLTETVGPDDTRILFMVDQSGGQTVGYMGLAEIDWAAGYGEADAVVRGRPAARGLMRRSLRTLLLWARETLGLATLGVRVRSDNTALGFYEKVGFTELRRKPLRREEEPGLVRWVEDEAAAPSGLKLVHMRFTEGA
jgi:RimJ/RimL family protein N-acetyltransferase